MLASPLAPLVHSVVDRRIAEAGEWDIAAGLDLKDDRALIKETHVEV